MSELITCNNCNALLKLSKKSIKEELKCSICNNKIKYPNISSLNLAWAYILSALCFLVPANIYPIMHIIVFEKNRPQTMFFGVLELAEKKLYLIAIVVFFASILVPIIKILILIYILISIHLRTKILKKTRARIHYIIEFIGRWSMLDIFVISIMAAIVQLGKISVIEPGVATSSFLLVIILSMLATKSIDARLIWEK